MPTASAAIISPLVTTRICRRLLAPLVLIALAAFVFMHRPIAQGRGVIQTPGGGRGPGAARDAKDPANANADLSPKPPVVPPSPAEQAKQFWLPPGYRIEPVLSDPVIESPGQIVF